MDTVKSSNETSIYIIDDNYRIVHFNSALRDKFPELQCGDICYEKLCQEAKPCARCPFEREDDEAVVFYNKVVQKWLEVGTGRIDWPGMGTCNMVLVREIHEGNKNLFYSLTNIAVYDELFELDFTGDSYRLLYHAEDKYVIPGVEGNLGRMLEEMAGAMIHPEDRDSFREFWNRERMKKRSRDSSGGCAWRAAIPGCPRSWCPLSGVRVMMTPSCVLYRISANRNPMRMRLRRRWKQRTRNSTP